MDLDFKDTKIEKQEQQNLPEKAQFDWPIKEKVKTLQKSFNVACPMPWLKTKIIDLLC